MALHVTISSLFSRSLSTRQFLSSLSSGLFVRTCRTSLSSETSCEYSLPPAVEQEAAARPRPLLLGRTRSSQSTSLIHRKRSGSHAAVPLITRGAKQERPETQRQHSTRLSANLAVKGLTPQLTSKNNIEPQTDVARHSPEYSHSLKCPDLIPFDHSLTSSAEVLAKRLIGTCA